MNMLGLGMLGYLGIFQVAIILIYLTSFFIGFGVLHAYLIYEKKAWLKNVLASGDYSDEVAQKLQLAATPNQSFPLYKYLKFYLSSVGVVLAVSGILTITLPESMGNDMAKLLVFIPVVIGAIFYFMYQGPMKGNGLFRELTGLFSFVGFAITFNAFFPVYEIDWFRTDLLIYITLIVGLFLISHLESVIASYVYIIAVIIASFAIPSTLYGGSKWLEFLHLFIWPFGFASLFYWGPRIKEASKIELREITFGVLFMIMVIALGINNTYGFEVLAMVVILPSLYFFSKVYYAKAIWFLEKPIQTAIVTIIIYALAAFSFDGVMDNVLGSTSVYTSNWGIMKIFSLLIIAGIGFYGYSQYQDNFEHKPASINLKLLGGIGVIFIASFMGSEYYGYYLPFLYALYLGYDYTMMGIKSKNEIVMMTGVTIALIVFIGKIVELLQNELNDRMAIGGLMVGIGVILIGTVYFLRFQWTVTNSAHSINESMSQSSDTLDR